MKGFSELPIENIEKSKRQYLKHFFPPFTVYAMTQYVRSSAPSNTTLYSFSYTYILYYTVHCPADIQNKILTWFYYDSFCLFWSPYIRLQPCNYSVMSQHNIVNTVLFYSQLRFQHNDHTVHLQYTVYTAHWIRSVLFGTKCCHAVRSRVPVRSVYWACWRAWPPPRWAPGGWRWPPADQQIIS